MLMAFLDDFRSAQAPSVEPQPTAPAEPPAFDGYNHAVPAGMDTSIAPAPGSEAAGWEQAGWEQAPGWEPVPSSEPIPTWEPAVAAWAPPTDPARAAAWPPPTGGGSGWAPPTHWSPPPVGAPGAGRRGNGGWRRALWVVPALAVVGGAVAVVVPHLNRGPKFPKMWDSRVTPIVQFVQTERGLTWKHPVEVKFLPASQFDALMAKQNAPDASATRYGQTVFDGMRALGVASGNVDLAQSAQQFAQNDIVGQYVDSDHTVYVRGDTLTPYVRSVLAHELTHALQAEYFNLERIRSGHNDDDSAVTALIEGDAVRVQNAYEQTLSPADQELLAHEQQQTGSQAQGSNRQNNIPQFLIDQAQFPYDFGPTFVAALVAAGGNAEVDAAFRNPPTTDAEIVDPVEYTPDAGAPSVHAPAIPPGSHEVMPPSGFGQVTLLEMLGDQIGFDAAWPAVQSWEEDQWVAYTTDGRVCGDLAVLNDSPSSASTLLQAGRAWASHLPSAGVSQSGSTVYFHSCDPGAAWKPAPNVSDPYQALAVRSVVMYQLIADGHLKPSTASCASDQLLTSMGPDELEGAEQATDANSPDVLALRSAVRTAVQSCA